MISDFQDKKGNTHDTQLIHLCSDIRANQWSTKNIGLGLLPDLCPLVPICAVSEVRSGRVDMGDVRALHSLDDTIEARGVSSM